MKKREKVRKSVGKVRKSEKKVHGSVSSSLLHTQVRFSISNYIQLPGNALIKNNIKDVGSTADLVLVFLVLLVIFSVFWDWVWMDLCARLLYEHRFAMLKMTSEM